MIICISTWVEPGKSLGLGNVPAVPVVEVVSWQLTSRDPSAVDALQEVLEGAALAVDRDERLASEIASGTSLADAFQLQAFLAKRDEDSSADFNTHLKEIDRAI